VVEFRCSEAMKRTKDSTQQNGRAVLVVAAHPDDEVLGCGGTLARMAERGDAVHVLLIADGETSRPNAGRGRLAKRRRAAEAAAEVLGVSSVQLLNRPDNRLDSVDLLDVVRHVESVVARHRPSVVLTHHAGDVNIDHRIVHDAVIAACRPQPGHSVRTLLFFEVPSSTEWRPPASAPAFTPNWFVEISATLRSKLRALEAYSEELRAFPHPRSRRAVEALARWRGASVGVEAAEAFILGRYLD
jgi:N-acetylglucosamine malate deacetylase 1